ncbi:Sec-independent protein translocase subunit TatA [Actinophytocola sp.]|uniref:Sec-independent protein translocase subunit TatA n=1 Tax=Actinophytocola sp. TaxID=1872138 RepID=UPI00389A3936
MGNLGVPELLIIAGVIVLLFGARKLPEMARSLGKSAKAFKEETKGLRDNDKDNDEKPVVQQQLPQAQPPAPTPAPEPPVQQQAQTNGVVPQSVEQQNKNA